MRYHEFSLLNEASPSRALLLPTRIKRQEMLKKLALEIARASVLPKPTAADMEEAMRMYQQAQRTVDAYADKYKLYRPYEFSDRLFGG